jgi:hypothetical protein
MTTVNQFRSLFRVLGEDPAIVSFYKDRPSRKKIVQLINVCRCAPEDIREQIENIVVHPQSKGWALGACNALDSKLASNGVKKLTVSKLVVAESNDEKEPSNGAGSVESNDDSTEVVIDSESVVDVFMSEMVTAVSKPNGVKKLTVSKPVVAESNDVKKPSNGYNAAVSFVAVEAIIPEMVTAVVDAIMPLLAKVRIDFGETVVNELCGLDTFLRRLLALVEKIDSSKDTQRARRKVINTLPSAERKLTHQALTAINAQLSAERKRKHPTLLASRPPFV